MKEKKNQAASKQWVRGQCPAPRARIINRTGGNWWGEGGVGQTGTGQSSTSGSDKGGGVGSQRWLSCECTGRTRPDYSGGPWGCSTVLDTSTAVLHMAHTTFLMLFGFSYSPLWLMSWLLSVSFSFSVRTWAFPIPPWQTSFLLFSGLA